MKASIIVDVNVQCLEISRGIDQTNSPSLNEVICHNDVLLVGCNLGVMWADRWLILVWVVKALYVVEIGNIERGDVVCCRKGEVDEFSILSDVRTELAIVSKGES